MSSIAENLRDVCVFLDTHVFLHYEHITQIDWPSLMACESVTLVVAYNVIKELEEKKVLGRPPALRERASQAVSYLGRALDCSDDIRPNVNVVTWLDTPAISDPKLSHYISDDRLIAALLSFRQLHDSKTVVLSTNDMGLGLKAKSYGVRIFSLPDSLRRELDVDETEAELRRARNQLAKYESRNPKLSVVLEDNSTSTVFRTAKPIEYLDGKATRLVAEEKIKYPHMTTSAARRRSDENTLAFLGLGKLSEPPFLGAIGGNPWGVTDEDIESYNRDLDYYFARYANYIRDDWDHQDYLKRIFKLVFFIRNDGSAPANDIEVGLHFPDGFSVLDADDLPEEPSPPNPPRRPTSPLQNILDARSGIGYSSLLRTSMMPHFTMPTFPTLPPNVSGFSIKKVKSYNVSCDIRHLKHACSEEIGVLHLAYASWDDIKSFHVDATIKADELPTPLHSQIHVRFQSSVEPEVDS